MSRTLGPAGEKEEPFLSLSKISLSHVLGRLSLVPEPMGVFISQWKRETDGPIKAGRLCDLVLFPTVEHRSIKRPPPLGRRGTSERRQGMMCVCVCLCAAMDTVRMSASLWPNTEPGQGPIGQRSCVLFDDER